MGVARSQDTPITAPMDLLIVEPLDPDVVQWLEARHSVEQAVHLAREPLAFRNALAACRAAIIPPGMVVDAGVLRGARRLRAIGRVSAGAEHIDADACARARVEIVRPIGASAAAEAEFVVGAMLQLLRRVPVVNVEGLLVGRELGGATVGLVGMPPAARPLARLLASFGAQVVGYDPTLYANDPLWSLWGVKPVPLRELFERSDAVGVMLSYFTRYRGLIGDRYLAACKPNQVLVSLTHSNVFDEAALAQALDDRRLLGVWFDSLEPGALDAGRPLHRNPSIQVTPRVAATTRESRLRSAWAVARRIDEILSGAAPDARLSPAPTRATDDVADLSGD